MTLPFTITKPNPKHLAALLGAFNLLLAALALRDCFLVASEIGLSLWQSKTLLAVCLLLALFALATLIAVGLIFLKPALMDAVLTSFHNKTSSQNKWRSALAAILFLPLIALLPLFFQKTDLGGLFADHLAARALFFWIITLAGSLLLRSGLRLSFFHALLLALLLNGAEYRLLLFLPEISATPFSIGWSEGSRIYLPALFNSQAIFGKTLPLPILHPTLHLLLTPPYFFNAPILVHRLWRLSLLIGLSGITSFALLHRLRVIPGWLGGILFLWITLALLTLPVYLHLLPPIILLLALVSAKHPKRTLAALFFASVWAGLSRINWYPVPAMVTLALLLLDRENKPLTRKEALAYLGIFLGGTALAAISMQTYIRLSGIAQTGDFFTSLSSSLLLARLLPSETYRLGVLPGILLYALPIVAALFFTTAKPAGNPRFGIAAQSQWLLAIELIALFLGGLLVSTKIGGGSDIHNLDAFGTLLLIITLTSLFGKKAAPALPWPIALGLVAMPLFFSVGSLPSFQPNNPPAWQTTLQAIQAAVDADNTAGKPTLFISQRQLISLGLIRNVDLDPLYDREDLMEMAMSGNQQYLNVFTQKLAAQTYGAIIVDPLSFTYKGTADAMGAEHNAWTKSVIRPILCNYQLSQSFSEAKVAIYLPQQGQRNCPTLPQKGGN